MPALALHNLRLGHMLMKIFKCACGADLFFENSACMACGRMTGFCDELDRVVAFEAGNRPGTFIIAGQPQGEYRQCANYAEHGVCNGMVRVQQAGDAKQILCFACHFNHTVPNLSVAEHLPLWKKVETAKRRTLFTLKALQLDLPDRLQEPETGLQFEFIADKNAKDHFSSALPNQDSVFTGHDRGIITLNLAEADDVARASTQLSLGESYRTLLGHFRHEIGHFFWDRLIEGKPQAEDAFRAMFGDEREDYQAALDRHYQQGPPQNWQTQYISAYATMHPWEDWAETWAHYMHVLDTLETAQECGLQFRPSPQDRDRTDVTGLCLPQQTNYYNFQTSVDELLDIWTRFSVVLNSLNRSMGLQDAYPFVLTSNIRSKLKFVHQAVHGTLASTASEQHS